MKKKSNLFWIILLVLILAICGGWIGWRYYQAHLAQSDPDSSNIAVIYLDGRIVKAIDLDKVEEDYTITYQGQSGNINTVEVSKGRIRVHDATCPDQICVGQGWLEPGNIIPIACLPNSLSIEIRSSKDLGLDSMTR